MFRRAGGLNGVFIENPGEDPFGALPDLCAKCHAEEVAGFKTTKHFLSGKVSCNSCHDTHKTGGMRFSTENGTSLDTPGFAKVCGECHNNEVNEFAKSQHAKLDVLTCAACHNVHTTTTFTAKPEDNRLCLQCHGSYLLGFDREETIQAHVGDVHPLDPEGTGSARCTTCHMPPARRNNQDEAPHGHSMGTIAPADSADAIAAGKTPAPNSCAGITGCHDAGTPGSGTPYNLDSIDDNDSLQTVYETLGAVPVRTR